MTEFRVEVGQLLNQRIYGDSESRRHFSSDQGLVIMEIYEERFQGIEVSARHYLEQRQKLADSSKDASLLLVKLKRSGLLTGTVLLPAGQPAAGAKVAFLEAGDDAGRDTVRISQGNMTPVNASTKIVTTDENGRFELPISSEAGSTVAVSRAGFALASMAAVRDSGLITLEGYGRIEGIFSPGGHSVAGQKLKMSVGPPGLLFAFENLQGETDAALQGRVGFEQPPEGEDYDIVGTLRTLDEPFPANLKGEEFKAFLNSPERRARQEGRKSYSVAIGNDDLFLLDSVAPGTYSFTVTASRKGDGPVRRTPFARQEIKITVPEGSTPQAPIAVGEILLKPVVRP